MDCRFNPQRLIRIGRMATDVQVIACSRVLPNGDKPFQPFAGDAAGRGHGRPVPVGGIESCGGTPVPEPVDGVWWREAPGGLEAEKVLPDSPGQRAGIQTHDLLTGAQVLPDTPAQHDTNSPSAQTQMNCSLK